MIISLELESSFVSEASICLFVLSSANEILVTCDGIKGVIPRIFKLNSGEKILISSKFINEDHGKILDLFRGMIPNIDSERLFGI